MGFFGFSRYCWSCPMARLLKPLSNRLREVQEAEGVVRPNFESLPLLFPLFPSICKVQTCKVPFSSGLSLVSLPLARFFPLTMYFFLLYSFHQKASSYQNFLFHTLSIRSNFLLKNYQIFSPNSSLRTQNCIIHPSSRPIN